MWILFFVVSFLSTTIGVICGIGGSVIIKPVLDFFQLESVHTISFLSSWTALSMSLYSICKNLITKQNKIDFKVGVPLATGGAMGGILGNQLISFVRSVVNNASRVGVVQSSCLMFVTLATLLYTINKKKIRTKNVQAIYLVLLIGISLGVFSSFLGIGGGPMNLVLLYYFFSMETKTAAQSSLFIILCSQVANLLTVFVTGSVPQYSLESLILMICGGISGGVLGGVINKKIDNQTVERLFVGLTILIIFICGYNAWQYYLLG